MLFPSPSDFSNILMWVQKLLSSAGFLFSAGTSWSQEVYSEYKGKQNAVSLDMLQALPHETKKRNNPSTSSKHEDHPTSSRTKSCESQ